MRTAWVVAAGVGLIGCIAAVVAPRVETHGGLAAPPAPAQSPARGNAAMQPADADANAAGGPVADDAAMERDFMKELAGSDDRWEFAAGVLDEAKGGNGAAQYALSMALFDCKAFDDLYFRDGEHRRTYDEAMQAAVKRGGLQWEYVSGVFKRCKRLLEAKGAPFGTPDDWMKAATENGYPPAQAQTAVGLAWKARYESNPDRAREEHDEARRLALEALRTKDPAAIFLVGDAASVLDPGQGAANPHQWVWLLAACERGYDCSRQSAWYQLRCAFDSKCQPYDSGIVDVVRREAGGRFLDIERRAKELNEKLDQDRFDDLGL